MKIRSSLMALALVMGLATASQAAELVRKVDSFDLVADQSGSMMMKMEGSKMTKAAGAKQVCDAIDPTWIIPMHYYDPPYDFAKIARVDDFLALCDNVQQLEGAELTVDADTKGVLVMKYNG